MDYRGQTERENAPSSPLAVRSGFPAKQAGATFRQCMKKGPHDAAPN